MYTVRQAESMPHEAGGCPLMCHECCVCVHALACTCLDSALRNTICKHVHLVVRVFQPQQCFTQAESMNARTLQLQAVRDVLDDDVPDVDSEHEAEVMLDEDVPAVGSEQESAIVQPHCLTLVNQRPSIYHIYCKLIFIAQNSNVTELTFLDIFVWLFSTKLNVTI